MTKEAEATPGGSALPGWLRPWVHWRYKRFWLLVAVVVYTLAGFFLAPRIVEHVLVKTLGDTGRTATVAEVKTNPFLFTLDMAGFDLADTDGVALMSFDRLFVDMEASSLFHWAWTFALIRIEAAHPREERFEGSDTRFLRLLADLAGDEVPPEGEEEDLPPRAIIRRLEVVDARLGFIDRPTDDFTVEFGPITVLVDDVRTLPDYAGQQVITVQINDSDRVEWQGDLQLIPFRSTGTLELIGYDLPELRRFVDYYLPFDPELDRLDVRFTYHVALIQEGLDLDIEGLTAEVDGLQLVMDEGGAPVVSLAALRAGDGTFDLMGNAGELSTLSLDGLSINAALRADGSLSLLDLLPADLLPSPNESETPASATPAGPELAFSIGQLSLTNGGAVLEDQSLDPPASVTVMDLALEASGLDLADGTVVPLSLSSSLASGGAIGFEGSVTAFPEPVAEGRLRMEAVALAVAQPYIDPIARVRLEDGALDLSAELRHAPDQLLALAGELSVNGFELHDSVRGERLAAWESLSLDRFEADLTAQRVETSILEFQGLFGRFHIAEDLSTNVGDLLVERPDAGNETPAELPDVTIGGVRLDDAAMDFSDFSLPLPFESDIRAMDGDISTLSTTSSAPATVNLEGQVNEYGLARIEGELNAWDPTRNTDITMVFRNIEIAQLTPYTVQFAGYAIEEGRLDMDLGYRLQERQLQGDNSIVIREMQLGEKVDHPDAGSLPLGLAVALLKDSEGVIDIDVPVEGDLDNPEFRIGGVIWKAIGNLIAKVVTAPFRLLGNLVGVDSEDFGIMEFRPGSAELTPPDREKLVKLGEAMLQRPELALEVGGTWAPSVDRPALQQAAFAARQEAWLAANPGDDDELSTARDRRILEALFLETFPAEPLETVRATHSAPPADDPEGDPVLDETAYAGELRQRLVEATEVGDDALQALAGDRAQAVLDALAAAHPEAGLALSESAPEATEPGEDGTVPLELGVSAGG